MTHDALALRGLAALVSTLSADAAALYFDSGEVLVAGDPELGKLLACGDPSIGIARHSGRGWTCLVGARRRGFPSATDQHALTLAEGWWLAAESARTASVVRRELPRALHDLRNALNAAHLNLTIAGRRLATQDGDAAVIERVTSVGRHIGDAVGRVTRVEDLVLAAEPPGAQPPAATNAEPMLPLPRRETA